MSFSKKVKEELSRQIPGGRHCCIAETAAIISLCGHVKISGENRYSVKMNTENVAVARKYFTLLKKTFNIVAEITIRQNAYLKRGRTYTITVNDHEEALKLLITCKLINEEGDIVENMSIVDNVVVMNSCCKRAFVRGAFMASGSISTPEKFYHFEIVCSSLEKAEQLRQLIASFEIEAKIVERKRHYVVYIKDGAGIVDILSVMEAHVSLMDLENIRILKEMRNSVNRQVNCETANLNKTVAAALKQIQDIEYIRDTVGFETLPESLRELAELRLENTDVPLKELGTMLREPLGKSGVNHRLRKISEIADSLREN